MAVGLDTVLAAHGDAIGQVIVQAIAAKAPVSQSPEPSRPPGTLRDSFAYEVAAEPGGLAISVTSLDVPVVWYVLKGTTRGPVTAVNTRALRFYLKDGTLMFRHSVRGATVPANDFVAAARPEIEAGLAPIHEQVLQEWLNARYAA